MRLRFYFFFIFFTLFFLFYPGNSTYLDLFAYNRNLFIQNEKQVARKKEVLPIPVLRANEYPLISAEGAYVLDLPSFTPFFAKNEHQKFLPASITKIMTALVVRDLYKSSNEIVTVSNVETEGQVMGLAEGEQMTVENLLYGMLVYSGNDAAYAFAREKGYDEFIDQMNKKAKQLNMRDSHFSNPAGLDDYANYSSPYDLALAARELLKDPLLSKIVATREITVKDVEGQYTHKLVNINRLLGEIPGLRGLKTGSTDLAGENLVSFYKTTDHSFIIVVLKSTDRFADTKNVIDWINKNVDYLSTQ